MGNHLQVLLTEQARAYICGNLGHDLRIVFPLQSRDETREILCRCATCGENVWKELPLDGYERLLKDVAAGVAS